MIRQIITTLGEAEELIAELELGQDEYIIDYDGDAIITDNVRIIIPELHLSARCGMYCNVEDGEYMPDFALSLIYEEAEKDPEKWLYWEQDGVPTTLHNYLWPEPPKDIYEIQCIVEIED